MNTGFTFGRCGALLAAGMACCGLATAAQPETFLNIGDGSLRVTAGQPVPFDLRLPTGEGWGDANIAQLRVRTVGEQSTIPVEPLAGEPRRLVHTFTESGWALVMLEAGPAADKGHGDSWQRAPYSLKAVVRVDGADGTAPVASSGGVFKDPGLMGKVGMKIEVLPMMLPPMLRPGSDLPLRVYWEGASVPDAPVTAYSPTGAELVQTTDKSGITHFRIDEPGRWLIRFRHEHDGVTYTSDLAFEVSAPQLRRGGGDEQSQ